MPPDGRHGDDALSDHDINDIAEVEDDALDFRAFTGHLPRRPLSGGGAGATIAGGTRRRAEERARDFDSDDGSDSSSSPRGRPPHPPGVSPLQLPLRPLDDDTERRREFVEAARRVANSQRETSIGRKHLEVRTYIDLQSYNLTWLVEKKRHNPGPMQLIFMFYSRIYDKLVGKQRGVDVPLFDPIDLQRRSLPFHALLDWAQDFKLSYGKIGRRELERLYCTVHEGGLPPKERFESRITYAEFVRLVALMDGGSEPMDRSKLDGSRTRCNESHLERLRRLTKFLCFDNVKKVKLMLHNAYRDVHFWKLSSGDDFSKEARATEMRCRPQWNVQPIAPRRSVDPLQEAAAIKYLQQFTWIANKHMWEEFEAPFVDMGTAALNVDARHFKVLVYNRGLSLARLKLEAKGCGPLQLPVRDSELGPGQHLELRLDSAAAEPCEWFGEVVILSVWAGADAQCKPLPETVSVPMYMRAVDPQADETVANLPECAPRPVRPGSNVRIPLDPLSLHKKQLHPKRCGSRPSSAATASTTAGCSSAAPTGRSSSRHGRASSRLSRSGSRPCSGGLRGVHLAQEMAQGAGATFAGHAGGAAAHADLTYRGAASATPVQMVESATGMGSAVAGRRPSAVDSAGAPFNRLPSDRPSDRGPLQRSSSRPHSAPSGSVLAAAATTSLRSQIVAAANASAEAAAAAAAMAAVEMQAAAGVWRSFGTSGPSVGADGWTGPSSCGGSDPPAAPRPHSAGGNCAAACH